MSIHAAVVPVSTGVPRTVVDEITALGARGTVAVFEYGGAREVQWRRREPWHSLHRVDGPARRMSSNRGALVHHMWHQHGAHHRADGPEVASNDGFLRWSTVGNSIVETQRFPEPLT